MLATIGRVAAVAAGFALACVGVLVMDPPEVVLVLFRSSAVGLGARALGAVPPGRARAGGVVTAVRTSGALAVVIGSLAVLAAPPATSSRYRC